MMRRLNRRFINAKLLPRKELFRKAGILSRHAGRQGIADLLLFLNAINAIKLNSTPTLFISFSR